METYKVDGKTLLLLDEPDFSTVGITNRIHIIKIKVACDNKYDITLHDIVLPHFYITRSLLQFLYGSHDTPAGGD